MEDAVTKLLPVCKDAQLIVICGKNEKLQAKLAAKAAGTTAKIHGFVNNVHEFMEASDIVIGKSGGLTTSESLARGLPMVVFSPIPGQEERNCDYLMENGAALKAASVEVIDYKLCQLLEDSARLARMKDAARRIARPHAGRDILARVLESSR